MKAEQPRDLRYMQLAVVEASDDRAAGAEVFSAENGATPISMDL